ncbi:MAG: hypothetical protein ABI353_16020 [Isosphaeraceae bacterium]
MSCYQFPGHPAYLARAAKTLGLPVSASDEARRQPALTRLANLIAQASDADVAHAPGVLAEALKSRDALAVALDASELALIDAHAGLGLTPPKFVRVAIGGSPKPAAPPITTKGKPDA